MTHFARISVYRVLFFEKNLLQKEPGKLAHYKGKWSSFYISVEMYAGNKICVDLL